MARKKAQGSSRGRGMGLGIKFALLVSISVTIIISLLGLTVYNQARTSLDESMHNAGTSACAAGAAPDWHHPDNQKRLRAMITDTIREVIVWETQGKKEVPIVIASGAAALEIDRPDGEFDETFKKVRIADGTFKDRNGKSIRIRSFRHPIYAPDNAGKVIGKFEVVVSKEKVEEQLGTIAFGIIAFTIMGILIGAGVPFLIARSVTRPLNVLTDDVQAVARGDFHHRTRVRSNDEIGMLAHQFNEMTRALEENVQLKQDLSSKEHQEHLVEEIQEKLIPSDLPKIDGGSVHAAFESGGELSSDLFDFIEVGAGKTGLLVLSASGRGVPAAIVLAMARSVFRATAPNIDSPAEALRRINALFSPDMRRGMYVTASYVIYDSASHSVKVASAGHKMPAIIWSTERGALARVHPSGIAMGLDKGPVFDKSIEEAEATLEREGDAVLVGSAGVFELTLNSGEPLGDQRFYKVVQGAFQTGEANAVEQVIKKIDANLADDPGEHDITLVTIHRS